MEQKKIQGLEWELQVKQTHHLLGQPNLHRAGSRWGGDKCIKEGSQNGLSRSFGVSPPSRLMGVLSFACWIKLSCNQVVTLIFHVKYLLQQDRTEEITHSADIFDFIFESYERKISWGLSTNLLPTLPSTLISEKSLNNNELLIQKVQHACGHVCWWK